MKKIISILFVALIALAFMGCPTVFKDRSFLAQVGDLIGDMNGDGIPLVVTDTTASASFTYAYSMNAWNGGSGVCNFKIRKVAGDWAGGDYGYAAVKMGSLPEGVIAGESGGNIQLTGLVDGTEYEVVVDRATVPITITITAK